jgi:hypothetical protein
LEDPFFTGEGLTKSPHLANCVLSLLWYIRSMSSRPIGFTISLLQLCERHSECSSFSAVLQGSTQLPNSGSLSWVCINIRVR